MELSKYEPEFKIVAASPQEAIEISNFFVNLMNRMPYPKLLKAARKVNAEPESKVDKMGNYIFLL